MTHKIVIICRTQHFVSTLSIFNLIQISLPNFAFFMVKSPSVTHETNNNNLLLFFLFCFVFCFVLFCKTEGSDDNFSVIKNNFRFSRKQSFEYKVTEHYGLGKNTPSCGPLISSTSLYLLRVVRMSTVNIFHFIVWVQSPMHFLCKHTSMQQSYRPSEGCGPQQRAQNCFFFPQVFFQGFWIHSCIDVRVMKAYKLNAFRNCCSKFS